MLLILKSGISGVVFLYACPPYWFLFSSCLSILSMCLSCPPNFFLSFRQLFLTVNAHVWQFICPLIDYNIDIDSWNFWDYFFLLLGFSILLMDYFRLLYQLSLSVDAPFFQCFLMLIDLYIDSWYFWDCFLSVIAPVRPYMRPPLLLMHISLLSSPPINVSFLCPVNTPLFISSLTSVNSFVCWWKAMLIAVIVGIVIAGIFGILFCLFLHLSVLLMHTFCVLCQFIMVSDALIMGLSLRFSFYWKCWKWINMLQTRAPSGGAWTRAFLPYIKPSSLIWMQLQVELGWYKQYVQLGDERTYVRIRTPRNITGCQGYMREVSI